MTTYKLVINLKNGNHLMVYVHDVVPKTAGNNLLMWTTTGGAGYMVNELEISYIEFEVSA